MIRYLLLAIVIYAAFKLFSADSKRRREAAEKDQQKKIKQQVDGGDLVKDPVCGAYVSEADSISVKDKDKIHRFCSYDCRDIFLKQNAAGECASVESKDAENGE
jgi:YHS domain-containing protein